MSALDWLVLIVTLGTIVVYGIWKSRHVKSSEGYLAGHRDLPWWTIGLSIMATQASAITFLSTPGQGYSDGMQFIQFYFGMPLAMIFLVIFILPVYYKLKVTTAYEYLEHRFGVNMRTLTAILFLIQRGVAAAISIYAPSIILSIVFGWNLAFTNFLMAVFVILYTTTGGSTAVSKTQEIQMSVMLGGLVIAFLIVLFKLPEGIGVSEAWQIAGSAGKTQTVDWGFPVGADGKRHFDWNDRYNIWSGLIGATFLFLSYFGTDQSQVGRYLAGKSLKESRFGLLFNGFIKIPMQFLVLSVGVMVYVFYQFNQPPLYFNEVVRSKLSGTPVEAEFQALERQADSLYLLRKSALSDWFAEKTVKPEAAQIRLAAINEQYKEVRMKAAKIVETQVPSAKTGDKDYIFIQFILSHIPKGLIGLMIAVVFCASWSTTASELSALSATTVSDIYRRSFVPNRDDNHYFRVSRFVTVGWGGFIVVFASVADIFENLIQAVNMVGSIFYGTILGIFFTAFFLKKVKGKAVFYAALLTEAIIVYLFFFVDKNPYLWYNPLACGLVMGMAYLFQGIFDRPVLEKNGTVIDS